MIKYTFLDIRDEKFKSLILSRITNDVTYKEKHEFNSYLVSAFAWKHTPERDSYWRKLRRKVWYFNKFLTIINEYKGRKAKRIC